ncbi:MAG: DNA polymerase IV [Gammaproteobacteria bacterium]|nr:DNA polymerase IV [Gammaproteobacteria bacterium]MDH3374744.1 DNA polymerase IV [Gammaproteobacteria bacterium]MDH3551773.1 DNA polymerase IV [Gammaproteobacteria bacterium]
MTRATRTILHVDMDAFYASVEQRDNPRLRGKPVVVGGGNNRGVVAAASYEVRQYGVRSAMPMSDARRRCPELIRVQPRMSHYQAVSRQIFTIFREFTPLVEGLSLDEAFLDVTASRNLHGSGVDIAKQIKRCIRERTSLTASVGVAENKLVAKIASDMDKPDGLVVIRADNCCEKLDPLPVAVIPGIGPQTLARLQRLGIHSVGDLRLAPDRDLANIFGRFAARTRERAAGIDNRPVAACREEKSISAEETYEVDLSNRGDMERELLRLAETTARRLRKSDLQAGTVQIKIRQSDFQTFTRQKSLHPPAHGTDQIYQVVRALLDIWLEENPGTRIRLLGVGATKLSAAEQRDLFAADDNTAANPIDRAVDGIRDRFGNSSVGRARTLDRP